jgi:hypothetical protein
MSSRFSHHTYLVWTKSSGQDEGDFGFEGHEVIAYLVADTVRRIDLRQLVHADLPINPGLIIVNERGRKDYAPETEECLNDLIIDSASRRCWLHVGDKNQLPNGRKAVTEFANSFVKVPKQLLTRFSGAVRFWSATNTLPWDITMFHLKEAWRSGRGISGATAQFDDAWTQCSRSMGLSDTECVFLRRPLN